MVVDGNLQVVHARFADADFFIREDMDKKLEEFVPKLSQLTFQKELGSMLDKTNRLQSLVEPIARRVGLEGGDLATAERVATLCKADLASEMVVEMTALQGIMGRYYALCSGEPQAVADGIYEHYLPRYAEDTLPESLAGTAVGIADRLDSLVGLFAVGLAPTGNKDPFALRRSALGLVQILVEKKVDFNLTWALEQAAALLPVASPAGTVQAAQEFIATRLRGLLLDQGKRYDVVDAVLKAQSDNPAKAAQNVEILSRWVANAVWTDLLPAYSRCYRITRDLDVTYPVNPEKLQETEEFALHAAVCAAEEALRAKPDLEAALCQVRGLIDPINTFFNKVLVMAEDEAVRQTRLGLLQRVVMLLKPMADLVTLEGF